MNGRQTIGDIARPVVLSTLPGLAEGVVLVVGRRTCAAGLSLFAQLVCSCRLIALVCGRCLEYDIESEI